MKEIRLTNEGVALVDDDDFYELSKMNWRKNCGGYAVAKKKGKTVSMSRLIMKNPQGMVVDHINGIRLDNRKENLRICTQLQNAKNKGFYKRNKSGFRGVHKKTADQLWYAQITENGVQRFLGCFKTPEEASVVYEKEAIKAFGEYKRK